MALSQPQQLELVKAEKAKLLESYTRTLDVLSMYRSLAPDNGARDLPPHGYWIKHGNPVLYGTLLDGRLKPLGKKADEETAIAACWQHFDSLDTFVTEQSARLQRARDSEQIPAATPRRRRRVINE